MEILVILGTTDLTNPQYQKTEWRAKWPIEYTPIISHTPNSAAKHPRNNEKRKTRYVHGNIANAQVNLLEDNGVSNSFVLIQLVQAMHLPVSIM